MPLNKASVAFVKMTMPERYGDLDKSSNAYTRLVTENGLVKESGLYYDRSVYAKKSSSLSYSDGLCSYAIPLPPLSTIENLSTDIRFFPNLVADHLKSLRCQCVFSHFDNISYRPRRPTNKIRKEPDIMSALNPLTVRMTVRGFRVLHKNIP